MACPYGVIRFHEDPFAPPGKAVAVKCDNCDRRRAAGLIPACVDTCKSGALTYEVMDEAMRKQTNAVARSLSGETPKATQAPGWDLLNQIRRARLAL